MAAILFLPFGRCSQLPYSVAIKTCSLHQPPTNPALPGFILIGIKIVNSFRNYLMSQYIVRKALRGSPAGIFAGQARTAQGCYIKTFGRLIIHAAAS